MKFSRHALLMAIAPTMIMHKCVATDQNGQASVPGAMTAGSVSASLTSVSGAVDVTLDSLPVSRLPVEQPIVELPSAYGWRVVTYAGSGRPMGDKWWIVELVQFYSDEDCSSGLIDPDSGTTQFSRSYTDGNPLNAPKWEAENAFEDNSEQWYGRPLEGGILYYIGKVFPTPKVVQCVVLNQPLGEWASSMVAVQAYDGVSWNDVLDVDDIQIGDNKIQLPNPVPSLSPSDVPSSSPTSQIQNFASGAEDDFQISAKEGDILFADEEDGGGSIIFNLEISKPLAGYSPFVPSVKVFNNDCFTTITDSSGNDDPDVITVASIGEIMQPPPSDGAENMDYRPVTVNVDVKQLTGSSIYSDQGDGTTGILNLCVRADIGEVVVTGGISSLSFVKMVFTITLNMEQDFSNANFEVTIEEKEKETDAEELNVDYGLQGCLCDAATRDCVEPNSDASKVKSNSAFAICAYTDSENVVIKSIRLLSITKGDIGYTVVDDSGDATNALFTSLSNMGSNREVVVTRMLSIFYGDEDIDGTSTVQVAGRALLEFASGRMRQLVSFNEVDVRSLQEAEGAGESAFDFDVQLDSAEIDEAGTAAKMSGYAMNVVVMALGMSMVVLPW